MSTTITKIMQSYNSSSWPNESFPNLTAVFQDYAKGMTLGTEPSEILLVFLYSVVFVISFLGNVSVLLLITLTRKLRNITNMLLSNMAVADLSVTILCMPMAMARTVYKVWIFGEAMCKLTGFFQGLAVVASIFTISILSLDRLLAIKYPMMFRQLCTTRVAIKLTIIIWLLAISVMSPMLFVRKLSKFILPSTTLYFCHEIWSSLSQRLIYDICLFLVVYIIPGTVIAVSYTMIGRKLLTEDSRLNRKESEISKGMARHVMAGRKRVAKMLIILALLFLACWMPYHIINLYLDFRISQTKNFVSILPYTILLGHLNSAINPILYFYASKTFRRALIRMLKCQKVRSTLRGPVHVVVRYSVKDENNIQLQKHPVVKVLSRSSSSSRSSGSIRFSRSSSFKSATHRDSLKELHSIQKRYDSLSWSSRSISPPEISIQEESERSFPSLSCAHKSSILCQRVMAKHRREILHCSLSIPTTINEESTRSCSCSPGPHNLHESDEKLDSKI